MAHTGRLRSRLDTPVAYASGSVWLWTRKATGFRRTRGFCPALAGNAGRAVGTPRAGQPHTRTAAKLGNGNKKAAGPMHPRLIGRTRAFLRTLGSLAEEQQARASSDDKDLGCHAAPPFEVNPRITKRTGSEHSTNLGGWQEANFAAKQTSTTLDRRRLGSPRG